MQTARLLSKATPPTRWDWVCAGWKLIEGTPVRGRESDAPEIRCWRIKFDGYLESFGNLVRGTSHTAGHALSGLSMLENETGFRREPLFEDKQGT